MERAEPRSGASGAPVTPLRHLKVASLPTEAAVAADGGHRALSRSADAPPRLPVAGETLIALTLTSAPYHRCGGEAV